MLTVFPVRPGQVNRRVAGRGMLLAPFVGAVLGLSAAVVLVAVHWLTGSSLLAAVLAVGSLAWLTRGLHLDGLADLADGLGSGKPAEAALDIMKRSDIGPFGVVTLVLTLLLQVVALAQAGAMDAFALIAACVTGRLAVTWACRDGVPAARPGGLGALVAGTVRRDRAVMATAAAAVVLAILTGAAAFGVFGPGLRLPAAAELSSHFGGAALDTSGMSGEFFFGLEPVSEPPQSRFGLDVLDTGAGEASRAWLPAWGSGPMGVPVTLLVAMAAGLAAAALLRRRAVRRLGGITGDVLGALVETATTVTLLVCVLL
jgi:adenosylcobinamide-GDP ribazoletransferase